MSAPRSGLAPIAVVAALAIASAAAGCGSSASTSTSKSSTSTSAAAISKAAFLEKGNAICMHGNTQLAAAVAKLGKNPTKAQITAFVIGTYIPSVQAQIAAIRALGAPSGDRATVTNMLRLAQADLNKGKRSPALLLGNRTLFANFAKIAHPYGLVSCARSS
jgi:hypothetical protein